MKRHVVENDVGSLVGLCPSKKDENVLVLYD
jgi:hypothetical protein